mmetsp:Transcript_9998/g.22396  ORF Transcript_9998/g.22396 Transcript_9998/m.22396 type:complete len:83 (-) Transcript_9998:30-278(-)
MKTALRTATNTQRNRLHKKLVETKRVFNIPENPTHANPFDEYFKEILRDAEYTGSGSMRVIIRSSTGCTTRKRQHQQHKKFG